MAPKRGTPSKVRDEVGDDFLDQKWVETKKNDDRVSGILL